MRSTWRSGRAAIGSAPGCRRGSEATPTRTKSTAPRRVRCSRAISRTGSSRSAIPLARPGAPGPREARGPELPDPPGFISAPRSPIGQGQPSWRVPMREPARTFTAALIAAALLLGPIGSAAAATFEDEGLEATQKDTPVVLDALVLRPMGLVLTAVGTALFLPAAAV